jgi:hypothetical protein
MGVFITLTCPTCGGKLQITSDVERFACAHCGNEHLVRRGHGVVSLVPVVRSLDGLRSATDRTASELAIRRIQGEIAQITAAIREARNQLGLHQAKLGEHNYRRKEWGGCLIATPVLTLGTVITYIVVDALAEELAPVCALAGVLFVVMILWAALRVLFAAPIQPPRGEVETLIASATAEVELL